MKTEEKKIPMTFDKFEVIMETIQKFINKKEKFADFLETEICTDSYCMVNFGYEIEEVLISLLADEFKCWYSFRENDDKNYNWWENRTAIENDIENFFYKISNEQQVIEVDGKTFVIKTIKDLYDYLIYNYERGNYERNSKRTRNEKSP